MEKMLRGHTLMRLCRAFQKVARPRQMIPRIEDNDEHTDHVEFK